MEEAEAESKAEEMVKAEEEDFLVDYDTFPLYALPKNLRMEETV